MREGAPWPEFRLQFPFGLGFGAREGGGTHDDCDRAAAPKNVCYMHLPMVSFTLVKKARQNVWAVYLCGLCVLGV